MLIYFFHKLYSHLITTLNSVRARSRSIKYEQALTLFSLNHDLFTITDIETLGTGRLHWTALEVVESTILAIAPFLHFKDTRYVILEDDVDLTGTVGNER